MSTGKGSIQTIETMKNNYASKPDSVGIHEHPLFYSQSLKKWVTFKEGEILFSYAISNNTKAILDDKSLAYWGRFVQTAVQYIGPKIFTIDTTESAGAKVRDKPMVLMLSLKDPNGHSYVFGELPENELTEGFLGSLVAENPGHFASD